ncbi:MAG TPA: FMN-binding negative transcriptional regulator [Mycobacteriales bacterium]|nr:FMN-binding negative transcriptional regulator [Mycobacteriales bacterium]
MLIHPWDAATSEEEWRSWLAGQRVGTLVCPTDDLPVVVPTHFAWTGEQVLLHLARPNPALAALEARPRAVFSVTGDWAYVPSYAKAIEDEDPALGIPTSYYAAVNLACTAELLDGEELLAVLRTQLGRFEPGSGAADPSVHLRRLPGIRGVRLSVESVQAKFKYGGNVDDAHRARVAEHLRAQDQLGALGQLSRRTPLGS